MSTPIRCMDLFAGCGGLSLGLMQAGIDVQYANEVDADACNTYRANHPSAKMLEADCNQLLNRIVAREGGLPVPGEIDLLVGGPPCQGFSGYNRHRRPTDPRNSLMDTFLDYVSVLAPRYVLIENVPGLLSLKQGVIANALLDNLKSLGYATRLGILQAGYYGLPQSRWRVFIWAALQPLVAPEFPDPTHRFPLKTAFGTKGFRNALVRPVADGDALLFGSPNAPVTVGDAISDLPPLPNGGGAAEASYAKDPLSQYQAEMRAGCDVLYNHRVARLTGIQIRRCEAVPRRPGAGWLDLPDELKPKNLLRHGDDRYPNRFGRLSFSGVFNTILSRPHPYWSCVFHPTQDRLISARESARAQGFPDRFRFSGRLSSTYRQIGNAVPPLMAFAIARTFVCHAQAEAKDFA